MHHSVRNPRTGIYDYEFEIFSDNQVAAHCNDLRMNQQQWFNAGIDFRINALQQWKHAVEKNKQLLIEALCTDTGRKWETLLEVDLVASSIDRWCHIARNFFQPAVPKPSSISFLQFQQELIPYPLIGVISPWNFPLLLSLIDSIPALLAGCAVIVKPSEVTPRFIKVIQATLKGVPALKNVFGYLQGDGTVGAALIQHCDLVCFTGSTTTGKKVYEAASQRMIPVFLELGGKDPAIVLQGADLNMASSSILWGSTANAGQSCLSIERVYVQNTVYSSFLEQLVAKAKLIELNASDINHGKIGPIIFEKQAYIINEHLQDAINKGATVVYGNTACENHYGGWYCKPTIVTNVNHTMKLLQEETFGPIIPVMPFSSKEEAILLANDSVYGLSAAVFAATIDEAMDVGQYITAGAISINDCALTAVMHEGEKNSFKLSGIGGTRMGPSAIKRFMRQKVFIIKNQSLPSPWWYK